MTIAMNVLTLAQAAEFVQITPRTLVKLAAAGKFPGRKVGSQWRFLRTELEAYLGGTWKAAS